MKITGSNPVGGTTSRPVIHPLPAGSPVSIVTFTSEHVLPAAALVAGRVARLHAAIPILPAKWAEPAVVARLIAGLADRGAGLAAVDDGELVGFHAAIMLDGHGGRWSLTPDLGHAMGGPNPARLRERLYASLAETWVRGAVPEHAIQLLVDDAEAIATMRTLGFGDQLVDLVRDLSPVATGPLPEGVVIRAGVPADARGLLALETGLRRHLSGSPVFLRMGAAPTVELARRSLEDATSANIVAERHGELVGFLRIGPCATDASTIVRDAGTASITAAFTRPELRSGGIATALLAAGVDWAREAGYQRCAVDHEAANREAARFWSRHLQPVVVSMVRRLPPGTVV